MALEEVDLFSPGAQEHWYEAYPLLHADAPVWRVPGEGPTPGSDAFILSKYEDISMVVRDLVRFPIRQYQGHAGRLRQRRQAAAQHVADLQRVPAPGPRRPAGPPPGADRTLGRLRRPPRHQQMIREHADRLIDDWIERGDGKAATWTSCTSSPGRASEGHGHRTGLSLGGHTSARDLGRRPGHAVRLRAGPPEHPQPRQVADQTRILAGFAAYVDEQVAEKPRTPRTT